MIKTGRTKHVLFTAACCIAFSSHASVIINEIDYDQVGTDNGEFIELFNSGSSTIVLDDYSIELINGSTSLSYKDIDLSGFSIEANDYFVVCGGDASTVVNCDYNFTTTNGWFQNGAPDAVGLYESNSLIDSLSYEGSLAPFTEGDSLSIIDSNTETLSLGRITDGVDSNNNALDFQASCITPGSANIGGSGNCSTNVSTVPVPAAAWLFGSGLIGLVSVARRR